MLRPIALMGAIAVVLLAVSGAGGAGAQTPNHGGTVEVGGTFREPGCLNAFFLRCGSDTPTVRALIGLALRGAFRAGPDSVYRPDLVSRVDFTTTAPYTLIYHIRPQARWSDGTPLTARDFVFTHTAIRSARRELWEPDTRLYTTIRSVTAVDSKTVRVVLRSRYAGWRALFPRILPSHALRGEDFSQIWLGRIHNPKTGRPIGSGPSLVQRWERGRTLTFVRNPRFWRGHPAHLDRLVVRFCERCAAIDPEQVEWLRTGELDVVMGAPAFGAQFRELRSRFGVRARAGLGANWEHLDVRIGSGGHPALKRKRVRQALLYGIDRVALARALCGQIDARYPPSDSAVFRVNSVHYRPNWSRYRHRPAEVRRLLEREGCRRGPDGVWECDGQRLSLRLVTIAGSLHRQQTLELIQRQLRRAGIEIVPVYHPAAVLFAQVVPSGNFDLALFSWLGTPESPGQSMDVYGCGGVQNFSGYCQRLVTRDLDQARRILDTTRQAQVLNRADVQLAKDVPVIPLFQNPFVVASASMVRNVGRAAQLDPFADAENWWLER